MFWQFYGGVFWILIVGVEMGGVEMMLWWDLDLAWLVVGFL
jgi:hypothetical protein